MRSLETLDRAVAEHEAKELYRNFTASCSFMFPQDSSIAIAIDDFRLSEIIARYGLSRANGLGDDGLVFTNSNVLGTQVPARYRQSAAGAASLEVILPCASSGRQDILGASLRAEGMPYAAVPADAPFSSPMIVTAPA